MNSLNKFSEIRYSLKKALFIIFYSTVLVSGSAWLMRWYLYGVYELRIRDDQYRIVAIVQTGVKKEALKTVYLAELLNLSIDKPMNLYQFNTHQAEKKLMSSPVIKSARVKKIKPGVIYIDYDVREPIAFLGDYGNAGIDSEGVVIPIQPFFTPKNLPEIYLGLEESGEGKMVWGTPIQDKKLKVALDLLNFFLTHKISSKSHLKKVDTSQVFAPSYGKRQIVLVLEDHPEPIHEGHSLIYNRTRILRLNAEHYQEGIQEYSVLHDHIIKKMSHETENTLSTIIDLRIPRLAFVKD